MTYNPFSLTGKKIFVTGASSGIGRAVAIECSKMGAKLIVQGRDEHRLQETLTALEGEGHFSLIHDFSTNNQLDVLVNALPHLDGVVHCAGYSHLLPFQFINEKELLSIFQVNFFASTLLTKDLVRAKKISNNSSIVYLSSISGTEISMYGNSMYAATKGALNAMVKGMALDLSAKGIRVNSVLPGMVNTNMILEGTVSEEQLEEDMKRYPLKRYGQPEEVAYAVIYLLSDAAKWMTGSNLVVDGGYTLQ